MVFYLIFLAFLIKRDLYSWVFNLDRNTGGVLNLSQRIPWEALLLRIQIPSPAHNIISLEKEAVIQF